MKGKINAHSAFFFSSVYPLACDECVVAGVERCSREYCFLAFKVFYAYLGKSSILGWTTSVGISQTHHIKHLSLRRGTTLEVSNSEIVQAEPNTSTVWFVLLGRPLPKVVIFAIFAFIEHFTLLLEFQNNRTIVIKLLHPENF